MGFVAHAATEDLPDAAVASFLTGYGEACALSEEEIARFERVGALYDLEWIAIYASALTGEAVAAKEFASREFDRPTYLAGPSAMLKRRLVRPTERPGYRFRAG
jgi:Ser/Thr protein kinase RdoA (MazF antagonist)